MGVGVWHDMRVREVVQVSCLPVQEKFMKYGELLVGTFWSQCRAEAEVNCPTDKGCQIKGGVRYRKLWVILYNGGRG